MAAAVWPSRIGQSLAGEGRKACAQSSPPNLRLLEQIPALPHGCDVATRRVVVGKGLTAFGLLNKALLCEISYLMNQLFEGTSGPSPGPPRNVSFKEARTHPEGPGVAGQGLCVRPPLARP